MSTLKVYHLDALIVEPCHILVGTIFKCLAILSPSALYFILRDKNFNDSYGERCSDPLAFKYLKEDTCISGSMPLCIPSMKIDPIAKT